MHSKLIEELNRLGLKRYTSASPDDAVRLAHNDLLSAPEDWNTSPPVSKMMATDALREAAQWAPELITEPILHDCQKIFSKCNDSSRINIIKVFGIMRCMGMVPFLEQVKDDKTRPNTVRICIENGNPVMKYARNEAAPDWVHDAAKEAIQVIRGELSIAHHNLQGRWIYSYNSAQW